MTWARLDDAFYRNAKQLQMSDQAFRVYVCSLSYCAQEMEPTGFLSTAQARALIRSLGKQMTAAAELVKLNAWESIPGGYLVHDFDQYVDRGSRARTRAWRDRKRHDGADGDDGVTSRVGSPGDGPVTSPRAQAGAPVPVPEPDGTEGTHVPPYLPEPKPGSPTPSALENHPPVVPPGGLVALEAVQGQLSNEYDGFVAELNGATGRHFQGDQESRRKYAIVRRSGRSAEDLRAAARGVAKSAHHMGLNDSQIPYNAPINVLRSKVLDQLIALGTGEIGVSRRATADEQRQDEISEWARRRSQVQLQ